MEEIKEVDFHDRMEERIFAFFKEEGIAVSHIDDLLFQSNSLAMKRLKQTSAIKLDLKLSPLRRNRAKTFCE